MPQSISSSTRSARLGSTGSGRKAGAPASDLGAGQFSVVDLFSGAGGASYGFHANPNFRVVGAVDVELGKPSTGHGAIDCNVTYETNIGVHPLSLDLSSVNAREVAESLGVHNVGISVLIACPPCTGFTRAISRNHLKDDPRNSLIASVADHARELQPEVIFLENARELVIGRFRHHLSSLTAELRKLGYRVRCDVHMLTQFGLPQQRERAVLIAVRGDLPLYGLTNLWHGTYLDVKATHVRRAMWDLPEIAGGVQHDLDQEHVSTAADGFSLERIRAVPHNGGSWVDLLRDEKLQRFLTPAMWHAVEKEHLNWYCDIYGRMSWDRPAPTIKRESAHPGNGRYLHPEQDRMCTVREMATLQGFPADYEFPARSRKNRYRHIGDAVPPLISYQVSRLVEWILTGIKPEIEDLVLPKTHLRQSDIQHEQSAVLIS